MLICNNYKIKIKKQSVNSLSNISIKREHMTKRLVIQYVTFFADPDEKLTFTTIAKVEIITTTERLYSAYYSYPISRKEKVEKQILELLDNNIIRLSWSPYNSPVWSG